MKPVAVVAHGAVSALGLGRSAFAVGEPLQVAPSAVAPDPELAQCGLRRPLSARVRAADALSSAADRDWRRARALLELAAAELTAALDRSLPGWRSRRVAVAIGTSGGGMRSLERLLRRRAEGAAIDDELAREALYFGPISELSSLLGVEPEPCVQVLAACASSTLAIGLGCRWLEQGYADLVVAGGYDALSPLIAAGFESLGATTKTRPAPFRRHRDGMVLGEGAALLALARDGAFGSEPLGHVLGFSAASDAVHVTAPDRTGASLARAGRAALADASLGSERIDIVSAHGTATPFNDAAEALAISSILGASTERAVAHPFKASIGHTLGAAGALETLAVLDALARGVLPAACGEGEIEPALGARLLAANARASVGNALKLSTAFGGANAALVLGRAPVGEGRALGRRPVELLGVGDPMHELARDLELPGLSELKRERLDTLSALALAAAANALARAPVAAPERSGVIVGSACSTIEADEHFARRFWARGARGVEPRRFPPTSPNLCAGQCSIALGLRGPSLAVAAGPAAASEALLLAHDLIESGDADCMVVVAAEDPGPVSAELFRAAELPLPRRGAIGAVLGCAGGGPTLDRSLLIRVHRQARAELGAKRPFEPGWPAFQALLAEVVRGGN
jgi:3-oxoacyl-[acyl-carrier-protein] synthase II